MLHTFHDGSVLLTIGARELVSIPTWKGNRVIDRVHVHEIQTAIGDDIHSLDNGYKIIEYEEIDTSGKPFLQSYIIDGQHRAEVVRNYFLNNLCEPDFKVVTQKKQVSSELEAIAYFNAINNVKPQNYSDPNLVANKYIQELEKAFNKTKQSLMRTGKVNRPYLSVDKIREVLLQNTPKLKESEDNIKAFVDKVLVWNNERLKKSDIENLNMTKSTDISVIAKSVKLQFMLAVKPKLPWIEECL
jgi:hypothetical protein